ncbi:MAG TPA: hypothetical protein VFO07_21050, partial [Roseiflexaceae bacterium]|nr:hypothetical protein [Roseiflexaceae bacterium]
MSAPPTMNTSGALVPPGHDQRLLDQVFGGMRTPESHGHKRTNRRRSACSAASNWKDYVLCCTMAATHFLAQFAVRIPLSIADRVRNVTYDS